MSPRLPAALATLALALAAPLAHADWPGYLGPNRDATATADGLLQIWPDHGLTELWTADIGPGFGGAAIRDNRVYLLDRIEDEADILRAFDLDTGQELWTFRYEASGRLAHHGSRSTPTVGQQLVYTIGGFGDLHAIHRDTGEPAWHRSIGTPEGHLNWGFAQSPLIHGDKLIIAPVEPDTPGLIALDKRTGETIWESEPFGGDYYSSPILRTVLGVEGIMINPPDATYFIDPDTGQTIWQYDGYHVRWSIPAPTVLPDEQHIFLTGGYDAGSAMIRVDRDGDGYSFTEIFRLDEGAQLHPPVFHDGHLYVNINENSNLRGRARQNGGLICLDPATGDILWRTGESPNLDRGAILLLNDKLIALEGETGHLFLIDPAPDAYRELASFTALPQQGRDNRIWAPLALSQGRLILRDQHQLKAYDLRQ